MVLNLVENPGPRALFIRPCVVLNLRSKQLISICNLISISGSSQKRPISSTENAFNEHCSTNNKKPDEKLKILIGEKARCENAAGPSVWTVDVVVQLTMHFVLWMHPKNDNGGLIWSAVCVIRSMNNHRSVVVLINFEFSPGIWSTREAIERLWFFQEHREHSCGWCCLLGCDFSGCSSVSRQL